MPLSKAELERLRNLPKRTRNVIKGPDLTVRDYQTWFDVAQRMVDEDGERIQCSNPNCRDPRMVKLCTEINGQMICRTCFLDGYLLPAPDQGKLI